MTSIDFEATTCEDYNVSIQAMRSISRNLLSALLNPPKIISTDKGIPRDWHGLAELARIDGEHIPHIQHELDPTKKLLNLWCQRDKNTSTIKNLLLHLEELDRFDVVADIKILIEDDIKLFKANNKSVERCCVNLDAERHILTRDDLKRVENGLEPQLYDAFVLFADEDTNFATEVIDKMENHYKLKLCAKDRDLILGVFEHESVIKLIAERCNRLIAIISPAFLESSSNKFFCNFAQSLGIEQRMRKIIPCLYQPCKVPLELSCYFMLDYQRIGNFSNFWERLRDSIKICKSSVEPKIYRSSSQQITTLSESQNAQSSILYESNTLKPKKEGVKFSSMVNLNYLKTDSSTPDINNAKISTTIKRNKTKGSWLKKFLLHKTEKYTSDAINESPDRNKKTFWMKSNKPKMAVAN